MSHETANINAIISSRTSQHEMLKDTSSTDLSVTSSSQDLEALLGFAVPANAAAITLNVGTDVVRYNPVGTASASNGALPSVFTIWGNKAILDTVELYSATSVSVGAIVHELNDFNLTG